MADLQKVSNLIVQVENVGECRQRVSNLIVQVENVGECRQRVSNLIVQVENVGECKQKISNLIAQVEWVGGDIELPPVTQEEIDEWYYSGMGDFNFSGVKEPQIWRY